ncbi:glycoside hydrolase family 28 protein [Chitinophaga tropicalis]|uniref:Polygalacturonase n=1 Tax=Chitinophaga tropicalis TaxID=2683588 RepID=A0A7K1U361_9BACT|nr:glycosyl hydrolase family 28 protein [Chitinophaga tropicalis]MVT08802.1 hypothetical protein [Chitinophaga tropicalis]
MKFRLLLFATVSCLSVCCSKKENVQPVYDTSKTYIITNYGASGNLPDNSAAIQKTIDTCAASGGGTVIVPVGTFLCGPVKMKSNITLKIENGAVLKALPYQSYPGAGTPTFKPFIECTGISHATITGQGIIEGQGSDWWTAYRNDNTLLRPAMIRMTKSTHITVSDITVQNAPAAHIDIDRLCDSVNITHVTINSPANSPNTDGIDTWSSNINITNCNINCGDDNIAMDSYSVNVHVKNCIFGTGHGCSVGSYTTGVHDLSIDSCTFNGTTNGIRLKSNRGRSGIVENISYSDITMKNVTNAFIIVSYYPKTPTSPAIDPAQDVTATTPDYRNIIFKNIIAEGSDRAGTIWGLPELPIGSVVFDNVTINAGSGMKIYFAPAIVFKNGSHITTTKGDAIITDNSAIPGINITTGSAE